MDEYLATYPALYSQKGTPVRFVMTLASKERIIVEPLRYGAGGLALKSHIADRALQRVTPRGAGSPDQAHEETKDARKRANDGFHLSLIANDGRAIKHFEVPNGQISEIEAFVVYPNGSTWQGRIFEGQERELGMLIWSWDLGRRLYIDDVDKTFGLNLAWPNVPTTVGILDDGATVEVCGCRFAHHSCPNQCDILSKVV